VMSVLTALSHNNMRERATVKHSILRYRTKNLLHERKLVHMRMKFPKGALYT